MKNLIEDLWFSYLIEERTVLSDSDRLIVNSSKQKRDKIYNALNREQKTDFDDYEENSNNICNIYEKEAFVKGVRFAVEFLFGAIQS